jgi:hypothetical protein
MSVTAWVLPDTNLVRLVYDGGEGGIYEIDDERDFSPVEVPDIPAGWRELK